MSGVCSEEELMRLCSECYLLLEQYKLRTNLVGINMEKEFVQPSYSYLEERITSRYTELFQKLKESVAKLEVNFRIAQANSLRTLNNIFRNYRRRVGTLANEPLSSLKYCRYERQEKMLLQSIIYAERQNKADVLTFKEELQRALAMAARQMEEKYRRNQKIKEDYNTVFEIIDKSECYTYKYYEGFERTMLTTVAALEPTFDKLNAFLSVWENVGSTKAYQASSARELESQEKAHEGGERRLRASYEEETEEQLQQLMKNCPQHSPQREQYRKRLNDLRRYNSQKQKKLDMVGKMYSKRRNRAGILVSRGKEVSVLEWVINLDNSKVPYSHQDQFKYYRADSDHSDYRPTPYENHRPLKTAEEAREHLQKQRHTSLNHEWWYDRFGREGTLDLILGESQLVQKRVEFQVVRQTELMNSDDRRKRELLEKQNYLMKENERRECLHVGYRHIHDKTELDWLMQRTFNTQYIPGITREESESSDGEDGSQQSQEGPPLTTPAAIQKESKEKKEASIQAEFPIVKIESTPKPVEAKTELESLSRVILPKQSEKQPIKDEQKIEEQPPMDEMCLQQQIITTYFREYSKKIARKGEQPGYKKTAFLYFQDTASIDWSQVASHRNSETIFVYTPRAILFFSKTFSTTQEKLKCGVYALDQEEEQQEAIKSAVRECFEGLSLVTVRFHPIYLDNEDVSWFMLGLLVVLVREGKMFQDSQTKDYVNEGRDIIQDFSQYYFPSENKSTKSLFMRKFMPQASHELFAPKKIEMQDNLSQKTAQTTGQSISVVSEERKKQKQDPTPLKEQLKEEKTIKRQPQPELPREQAPINPSFHEQRELKRSDSREHLAVMDLQLQMHDLQQQQHSNLYSPQNSDNDCEQL